MKKVVLLFFLFGCVVARAQYSEPFVLGFKAGINYSSISELSGMILPEDYFDPSSYNLTQKDHIGFTGGVFIHFEIPDVFCAIQFEVLYATRNTVLQYSDINDFQYETGFGYQYVSPGVLFKGKIFKGLDIRGGVQLGFVINPEEISYQSNATSLDASRYGEDLDNRQALRNTLKGHTDFLAGAGIGYAFPFNVGIEAMYYWGLSDVVATSPNSYGWIENSNRSRSVQVTLTYAIPLSKGGGQSPQRKAMFGNR